MSTTRWLAADEQRVWRALLDATRLLYEEIDGQLQRDSGLSHADYEILVRLSEAPQRTLRMSDLAGRTRFSRSRLSHAATRLEGKAYVVRSSCPSDKRGTLATLTDAGFAALGAAAPGHVDAVRRALLDPLAPEQVEQLGRIAIVIRDQAIRRSGREGRRSAGSAVS